MYAVVSSGGKQYRVEAGNELIVERIPGDAGATITFDRVLLVGDGEAVTVGTPTVQGATVSGTVLGEELGPKLIIFKFKQKATYRRKNGHRQHLMRIRIDEIDAGGKRGKARADDAAPEADNAEAKPAADAKPAAEKKSARARKASVTAEASDAADTKPERTRRPAAKTAEAEE